MTPDAEGLAILAATQDQVVSRDQLAFLGYDRHRVGHRVRTGRWRAVGGRVVLLHSGTPTWAQKLWVAVLHAGPESALTGLTAAIADGLEGFTSGTLHVLVPHGSDSRDLVDDDTGIRVRVRQSTLLNQPEPPVHPLRRPRRLRLDHAVVEAADEASSVDRSRLLIISSAQQGLVRPGGLRSVVDGRARLARRALLTEAIGDVEGGEHSLPEHQWSRAITRHDLPRPVRQRKVQRANGTWYLDADFRPFTMSVEINGTQHQLASHVQPDDHRRNVLGTGGRLVITVGSHVVRHQPGQAVVATAAALMSRGWSPAPGVLTRLQRLAAIEEMDLRTGDFLEGRPQAS